MSSPLIIFPIGLFVIAMLALFSGIGVVMRQQSRKGGWFTTIMWMIFSASISMGFVLFGVFVYVTQQTVPLAIGIGGFGFILVMVAGWLAVR